MTAARCPFCGEDKDLGIGKGTEDREGYPTWVYCGTCGAHGPWIYTTNEMHLACTDLAAQVTGWNDRPD